MDKPEKIYRVNRDELIDLMIYPLSIVILFIGLYETLRAIKKRGREKEHGQ